MAHWYVKKVMIAMQTWVDHGQVYIGYRVRCDRLSKHNIWVVGIKRLWTCVHGFRYCMGLSIPYTE